MPSFWKTQIKMSEITTEEVTLGMYQAMRKNCLPRILALSTTARISASQVWQNVTTTAVEHGVEDGGLEERVAQHFGVIVEADQLWRIEQLQIGEAQIEDIEHRPEGEDDRENDPGRDKEVAGQGLEGLTAHAGRRGRSLTVWACVAIMLLLVSPSAH